MAREVDRLLADVEAADARYRAAWPGPPDDRQPVQVLYVPADQVTADTPSVMGRRALAWLQRFAATPEELATAVGSAPPDGPASADDAPALWAQVHRRVVAKLVEEPVEDLRVDFEDGYVGRGPAQEAADAVRAARALASALAPAGGATALAPAGESSALAPAAGQVRLPFCGLRVKPFTDGHARRSVDTLDRFLGTLLAAHGRLPAGFVVTFPKVVAVDHVKSFAAVLAALEQAHGLAEGQLGVEVQVETTPSVLGADGRVALRDIRDAAAGRLRAIHFGVFDYTAAVGLPVGQQRLDHPACDFARHLLQVTFAGTEVRLSDGSTNVRPAAETREALHAVWQVHAAHVRHSLAHGFTQGWDLHPAHLVSRYATVFAHLLHGLDDVVDRLRAWHDGTSASGGIMDEPATIRVLARQLRAAVTCGAVASDDPRTALLAATGAAGPASPR